MKKIILGAVLGILAGAAIGVYGFSLYAQENTSASVSKIAELIGGNSVDIVSVTTTGSVESITEDKLVLKRDNGVLLEMNVLKDTHFYDGTEVPQNPIELGDVKVSDPIYVYSRIDEDGSINAQTIIVLEEQQQ